MKKINTTAFILRTISFNSAINTFSLLVMFLILSPASSFGQEVPVLEWARSMGGPQGDVANDIAIDASGNVYTTGNFYATADFDPGPAIFNLNTPGGDHNVFVSKLDANGSFVWAKAVGGSNTDYGHSIAVDATGNVLTTGYFSGTADFDPGPDVFNLTSSGANADIFVSKLDTDGNFVWAIRIGATSLDYGHGVTLDDDGNIYVTGFFNGVVDFDPSGAVFNITSVGSINTFILKLDTNSNFLWAKHFAATGNYGTAVFVDDAFNVYGVGYYRGTTDFDPGAGVSNLTALGIEDAYIAKLDANGNFVWVRSMGGTANTRFSDITVHAGGSIYATGFFVGTIDLDPGAGTDSHTAVGASDIFITKLDANGNFVWAKAMGGVSNDYGLGIITDADGNVYYSGYFRNTVDFDPGAGVFNLTSAGNYDIFLSKSDPDGNFVWAVRAGSNTTSDDIGKAITIDPAGTLYMAGGFGGTVDFDYGPCVNNLISEGQDDIFVKKIRLGTVVSPPTITSFTPTSGPIGTLVTIAGTNFSTTPANNAVSFFNNITATVATSNATSIATSVPTGSTTGKLSVTVNCITVQSAANFTISTVSLPTIISFSPSSGPVGTTVVISGTNFSATPANNTVRFNGTPATVIASTANDITTTVPASATTGKITVTVSGNNATSVADYTVTVPPANITISVQPESVAACDGETTSFTFSASGASNLIYQWQKFNGTIFNNIADGGGYSGAVTSILTIHTTGNFGSGEYRCRISGDFAADEFTEIVTLVVNPKPFAEIIVNGSELVASSGDSYQWYKNGVELSQATAQTLRFNAMESGVFQVNITNNGCTTSSDEFIYLMTGNESPEQSLNVFPNPFSKEINISIAGKQIDFIELTDMLGRPVKRYHSSSSLSTEDVRSGVYYLTIYSGSAKSCFRITKAP